VLEAAAAPHLAARLGGDEFALLVAPGGDEPCDVEAQAGVIVSDVVRSLLPHAGGLALTCSVGLSGLRPGDTAAAALRRADLAMFWAKRRPGVRVAVFDESMAEEADRRSLLLAQLPGAVERGELSLVFQPLYRLDAGTVAAAEALLRWRHPLFGDVTPSEFVPLAEESGDIREIGAWVLESAVAQVAAWRRVGRLLPRLLVNTSAAQFTDDLPDQVAVLLARHEVPPEQLVLEITESQLPGLAANTAIPRLRDGGVRIAMDDFGSGYSSLAQLARLPVDLLKVDRDFITNLSEASGRYVLDAVVALARSLGLETVAEGIEEDWQATEVAGSGVDYGQGFLFARPLTAEEMIARLEVPTVVRPRRPDTAPTVRSGSD
jgi:EAL domain-containing protein (putative c-di-GMP-specific phosphodiesterase class I)